MSELSITLTVEQWNTVLSILQDVHAPYRVTAPLIQAIVIQVQSGSAMAALMKSNGAEVVPS